MRTSLLAAATALAVLLATPGAHAQYVTGPGSPGAGGVVPRLCCNTPWLGNAGFEIKLGAHASLAPEVALRLTTGSWKDGSSIAGIPIAKGGATMTTFGGGLRLSIYAWRLGFVVAAHAGFGNITVTFEDSSGASADDSNLGFAFGTDFGVQFQVLRYLAAGLFFDITKTFTDGFQIDVGTSTAGDDISGLALSIGLAIKGKLPL